MLAGGMQELRVGDPGLLATDVGPIIDDEALQALEEHASRMARQGRPIAEAPLGADTEHGSFFAPQAYEIDRSEEHTSELQSLMRSSYAVFGLKKNTTKNNN